MDKLFTRCIRNLLLQLLIKMRFYYNRSNGPAGEEMLGAGLTGDDLAMVPEHWFSFPAPPLSAHYALALLYTFFTAAALIGNGLVVYIFSTLVHIKLDWARATKRTNELYKSRDSLQFI